MGEDGEEFADVDARSGVELARARDLCHHALCLNPEVAVVDKDLQPLFFRHVGVDVGAAVLCCCC